jgi:hypothetical protein
MFAKERGMSRYALEIFPFYCEGISKTSHREEYVALEPSGANTFTSNLTLFWSWPKFPTNVFPAVWWWVKPPDSKKSFIPEGPEGEIQEVAPALLTLPVDIWTMKCVSLGTPAVQGYPLTM